ncbi:DNA repair protein RAD5 [Debaryomyces fabryi]|uniref:DNA repair protein RAD5 n=1 Tax=Debaryomyces fabryi TaxID=58627 RepID=A0A0V1PZA8_9ASCO|nr:DNA repair protein RAD5 [Debaryomyces fabryi]KSA01581.1 DNA repair protein RAD5 [Debaryomyces fabryi]CUM49858.1 unnamed protein product [Debaryomyces fabryi]
MTMEKKRYFSVKLENRLPDLVATQTNEGLENPPISKNNEEESLFVDDEDSDIEEHNILNNNEILNAETDAYHLEYKEFESRLKSVVGTISSHAMNHLFKKYHDKQNYLKLAVQEYLQGIDESSAGTHNSESSNDENKISDGNRKRNYEQEQDDLMNRLQRERQRSQEDEKGKSWNRFIGSLNVQAWATRPTTKPLKYLEKLELRRLMPKKLNVGKVNKEKPKFGDSSIIRIYTIPSNAEESGREIGRIPEDITRMLVPLIDLDISSFYTTVMLDTEKRLSTGDSFYIQIDCYLSQNAFSGKELERSMSQADLDLNALKRQKKMDTRTKFDFSSETNTEAILRLRQNSLSRFFHRLNIKPIPKKSNNRNDSNEASEAPIMIDSEDENDESLKEDHEQQNLDQLKQIMQANQQSELLDSLPETTKPPISNFKLDLRNYQKRGLSWMLTREREVAALETLSKIDDDNEVLTTQAKANIHEHNDAFMNPLWDVFEWPKDNSIHKSKAPKNDDGMEDNYFYANMYNGELSLTKPIIRSMVKGGILADEMGLGKTISTLALINSVPIDLLFEENKEIEDEKIYASKTTLIIVPMSLLSQWQKEFDKANNNPNHTCFIYYGDLACTDLSPILCNKKKDIPIVIITTYGTVLNEFTRLSNRRDAKGYLPKIGLFSVKFFRIVLDEGHNIRNRTAKTSKAIYELLLNRKWVLTGTPVINRLDDLYSLVKFLELEPWSNFSYWKTFVTLPFEQRKISQTLDVVKSILEPIFIRRTKNMKQSNGKPLVELPLKEVVIEEIRFNEVEEKLYNWFKVRASQSFKEGIKSGDLFKKYSQILTHILRLRQVCCHVDLVGSANEMEQELVDPNTNGHLPETNGDSESISEVNNILDQYHADNNHDEKFKNNTEVRSAMFPLYEKVDLKESECSICTQSPIPIGEMALTTCGHAYCLNCVLEHFDFQEKNLQKPLCPNCRKSISKYKIFKLRHRETSGKEIRFHTKHELEDPSQNFRFQLYLYDPTKTSSKIQCLINHLKILKEQSPNEQVVVFSQFSSYLDIIENELKIQILDDFVVYKFDGRLNMNERQKILEKFSSQKHENKVMILLLSLKAGGVGLNLTTASRAFMMDPWWSPSVEDQAIDRIHRIGQNLNVKVTRFIMADSIETKMLKIQERKKQIGEAVGAEEDEKRKRRIEEMQILFEDD